MTTLKIDIQCGSNTCASSPGKFCQYFGTRSFGQVPVCMLFPDEQGHTDLQEENGWVQRCNACLLAEIC